MPSLLGRRGFSVSCGAAFASITLGPEASATTLVALSLEELVGRSDRVIVGTPVSHESRWVSVRGSNRIVTESRVVQEADWLQDGAQEDEILVVTWGGQVGSVQQKVAGEPALQNGVRVVLFVSQERRLARQVIGMSQGHYPVGKDGALEVVQRSHQLPHLVGARREANAPLRKRRAVDVLHGSKLDSARTLVRGAR